MNNQVQQHTTIRKTQCAYLRKVTRWALQLLNFASKIYNLFNQRNTIRKRVPHTVNPFFIEMTITSTQNICLIFWNLPEYSNASNVNGDVMR